MRARDIVGKKVASVRQTRINNEGASAWLFDAIYFEDGTIFYTNIEPGDAEPFVVGVIVKPTRGGK
jgi:hypothetical protein